MTDESDQTSNVVGYAAASGSRSGVAAESEAASSTSFVTMADQAIANKAVPLMYEYWKVLIVTLPIMTPASFHGRCSIPPLL
jgi:hypothetical protein